MELGLQAVKRAFTQNPGRSRPDEALLKLLQLSLTETDFQFNSQWFLQTHGKAMGKKFAPAYANLYWERTVFPKCPFLPAFYCRYLDDIFGVWMHSKEEFKQFINTLNTHHATIKVKYNLQNDTIKFLDTQVYIFKENFDNWKLGTRVFFKPTDTHALLHKHSFHPKHTFKGIINPTVEIL